MSLWCDGVGLAAQDRPERASLHLGGNRDAGRFEDGGGNVDRFHQSTDCAVRPDSVSGHWMISGTCTAPSKKRAPFISSPWSPSISPWSLVKMKMVFSSCPVSVERFEQAPDRIVHLLDHGIIGGLEGLAVILARHAGVVLELTAREALRVGAALVGNARVDGKERLVLDLRKRLLAHQVRLAEQRLGQRLPGRSDRGIPARGRKGGAGRTD